MGYLAFALISLGIILIISGSVSKKKNKRCSAQTQGTLIKIFETENSSGSTGHGYVYSYFVNGKEYQIRSTAINPNVSNIGDACPIRYNTKKPKEAQEFRYESNKVYTIILIVGIALVVLGAVLGCVGCVQNILQEVSP